MIDMTDDRRIYFLMIDGTKMTDGNGRPLIFFPEDAKHHLDELVKEGHNATIGKDAAYLKGPKHDSEL